jgi:hypothetical protein
MAKKAIFLTLFILISFLLISCMDNIQFPKEEVAVKEIYLSDISEYYRTEDFTDFGVWVFTVQKNEVSKRLKKTDYTLNIGDHRYPLKPHKINSSFLIAFLDESLTPDQIRNGIISLKEDPGNVFRSEGDVLTVEKVIITGETTENGTNTYEITLEDYLQLKADDNSMIFSNGSLIRPAYIKSCEENAYTLKRYHDAKQICRENTTTGAFLFLKERPDHEQLLFFGNANRVTVGGMGNVTVSEPDRRHRLRQLGTEGPLTGTNTFQITRDEVNNRFIIRMDRDILAQKQMYRDKYRFEAQLKSTTDCELDQEDNSNLYQMYVPFGENAELEVIRNARISADQKIVIYDPSGNRRNGCNFMSEAVKNAHDGDTIQVNSDFFISESTQCYISNKELTISTEGYPFTLDYTGSATRAFMLDGDASLTIRNAVIQNSDISEVGAAFFVNGTTDSLTVFDSVIGTNTSITLGGAFALYRGVTLIDNCTLTNNTNNGLGGAIYNKAVCTIRNSELSNNHVNIRGGAVYNHDILHFYNNMLTNNTAGMSANGIYMTNNATAYNSNGEEWRTFNSPQTAVQLIENRATAENTYSNNGEEEGDCIQFAGSSETLPGNISLNPSTGTEFERLLIEVTYETDGFFAEGSITFDTPDHFTITPNASVTIGTDAATTATVYTYSDNSITVDNITEKSGTQITLTLMVTIPTGYPDPVQSRNLNYTFEITGDADGSGSAWTPSQKSSQSFVSHNQSINTDFNIKAGYDYLRLVTENTTELLFDEQTALQTTVASITQALASTDGSIQEYTIDAPGGTLNPDDFLPSEATLTVIAEHGNRVMVKVCKEYGDFKLINTTGHYNLYRTLTEAIRNAETGEKHTIECSATTDIKEPEIVINTAKEITIKPAANVSQVTLNGNETHRVLNITGNASITFKSTVIRKGSTISDGGGIYFTGSNLHLENCTVENNYSGTKGGGLYLGGGKTTLTNTTIQQNRTGGDGGGIYMHPVAGMPALHFDSGSINHNTALSGDGGGIFRYNSGNIYTGYGCWNEAPNDMWGEYNIFFSVDISGAYHEYDLSHPAKVHSNSAQQGKQLSL